MFTLEVKTDRQSLDETEKLRTVSLPAPAINKLMVGGCEIDDIYHFTFRQLAQFQLAKNQKKFTVYNCNGNLKKKQEMFQKHLCPHGTKFMFIFSVGAKPVRSK